MNLLEKRFISKGIVPLYTKINNIFQISNSPFYWGCYLFITNFV